MTKALYTDAICSAASSMSTDKLHERVCAPCHAGVVRFCSVIDIPLDAVRAQTRLARIGSG